MGCRNSVQLSSGVYPNVRGTLHPVEYVFRSTRSQNPRIRRNSNRVMARFATTITVCLDNEEVALRLHSGTPTDSSAAAILEFQACKLAWLQRERATNAGPGSVDVRWCPAHVGIPGNELADQLAKGACQLPTERQTATIARARHLIERYESAVKAYWRGNCPERYVRLGRGIPDIYVHPTD